MGKRTHFLLRAAAIAVLVVEAVYPRPSTAKAPSIIAAPVEMPSDANEQLACIASPTASLAIATR